nr:ATP-binding cassette domain-containing protein [Enterococcus cecorum]
MIKVENIGKVYRNGCRALQNVSFKINQGEFVYVVGPSGSGKTTLFNLLTRQEEPTTGKILMGNTPTHCLKNHQIYQLRRQIGIVGQEDLFLPRQTVRQNLDFPLQALSVMKNDRDYRIREVLLQVGMNAYIDAYPEEMSVGQQKRIAIARAIINHPFVLIADEPTANLDIKTAFEMMKLFLKLNRQGMTVLISTHDSTMVNTLKKRVLELSLGHLIRDDKSGGYSTINDPKDIYVL